MIKGKFGRANFTPASRFQVKYLGSAITEEAGTVGIEKAVRKIQQEGKYDDKSWPKMVLEVASDGVKFVEMKPKSPKESKFISLESISYGSLNKIDARIFAFNHHKSPSVVECHAVACESEEKAKSIGLALYAAFREGHFQKLRRERRKSVEQKRESEKHASFGQSERANSLPSHSREFSSNSSTHGESYLEPSQHVSQRSGLTVDIGYDEQELDTIIKDLLMTVELEKAKIDRGVE